MQKFLKIKLAMPVMIVVFAAALAAVGIAQATTIGSNVSTAALTATGAATLSSTLDVTGATTATTLALTSTTNPQLTVKYDSTNYWTGGASATGAITFDAVGSAQGDSFTFADPVKVSTSTTTSVLTVTSANTSNASTTLAVYQFGTGDLFGLWDSGTRVLGVADGGALTATSTTNPQLTIKYDTNNYWTLGTSATGAVTFNVVGSDPDDSFTFADPVKITTSTLESLFVVSSSNTSNASTTMAAYQFGTGDIFRLYDAGTQVLKVADGGAVTVTSTANPQITVQNTSTQYLTTAVSTTGAVTFDAVGNAQADSFTFADPVKVTTSTLESILTVTSSNTSSASTTLAVYQFGTGDILNVYDAGTAVLTVKDGGNVGVSSSTPWGKLAVEQGTETYSFVAGNQGSSTPSLVVNGVNGNGRVGIASTSPSAMFGIGDGSATTTIDLGKVCFRSQTDGGATIYWWFTANVAGLSNQINMATSTTRCY